MDSTTEKTGTDNARVTVQSEAQQPLPKQATTADLHQVIAYLRMAEQYADVGEKEVQMAQYPRSTRWLAKLAARFVLHITKVITLQQRQFNRYMLQAFRLLLENPLGAAGNSSFSFFDNTRHAINRLSQLSLDSFLAGPTTLQLPQQDDPQVSILLVLYNRAELTLNCLYSILKNNTLSCEVILVDNASTDNTGLLLDRVKGARIIRNKENKHFLEATNQAAKQASGKYLLLLNNDTQVLADSIEVALRTIEESPDIGAVGGRIVRTDGTLQEAGCIVWDKGACQGYGRGDSPFKPEYMFRRKVDFCSGAFLLTPRALFESMGGLDEAFKPAYYEETDYCIRLWEAGKQNVYDPNVVVVHHEAASVNSVYEPTDLRMKNREIFVRHHQPWLRHQLPEDLKHILNARSLRYTGKKVLFIDDRVPHYHLGSGFPRSNRMLDEIVRQGHFVTYYPLRFPKEDWLSIYSDVRRDVEIMQDYGIPRLEEFLEQRKGYYDTWLISRPHNMETINELITRNPTLREHVRLIYDAEALYCLRDAARAELNKKPLPEAEIKKLIQAELRIAEHSDCVISVSNTECRHFREAGIKQVEILSHAVDIRQDSPGFQFRNGLLFVGAVHEEISPNADAVEWLIQDIFAKLQQQLGKDITLTLVGLNTVGKLLRAIEHKEQAGIQLAGQVSNTQPFYDQARIFAAPMRFGAGIPLKVIEAAGQGVPVVGTSMVAEQLQWQHGVDLLVADTTDEYIQACTELHTNEGLWNTLRDNAFQRVNQDHSSTALTHAIKQILAG